MATKENIVEKIPDTSDAEEWLTPELFIYQGKVYEVLITGQIRLAGKARAGAGSPQKMVRCGLTTQGREGSG